VQHEQRREGLGLYATMLPAKLPFLLITIALLAACGGAATATLAPTSTPLTPTSTPEQEATNTAPAWRYVNSGWLSPYGVDQTAAFTNELRAFVITNQERLDDFQQNVDMKRSLGTSTSLGRADFSNAIVLAVYYLWRPLQGDPLSVVGYSLEGNRADIFLELEESPQGKKYPYLFAPMAMVAVDRSDFPVGEPVDFVFHLNGEPLAKIVATVD
jgi:hypothetical protein